MLWGWKNAADFQAKAVEGYAKMALGCNEPNEVGQSNMDAWSGIQLWRQYMLPLASKGYTLISPAMSSRPNGKDWMATFMANCGNDCNVAGIATHYYGTDIEEFKTYVTYWHTTYNLPVYITEYADQDFNGGPQADMDQIWAFMVAATEFMNANSWVKAHCWFGAMEGMDNVNPLNKLMNDAGDGPNDLGSYFINN
jgi:O-glycosyl hydrolase